MEQIVTNENFQSIIDSPVAVIDFWATWCAPCRRIAPIIEELAEEYAGRVTLAKCDIEENDELTQKFQVMSVPTVLFFKNGALVDKIVGAAPKDTFKNKIEELL